DAPSPPVNTSAYALALNSDGTVLVTGASSDPSFPITSNAFQTKLQATSDIFVTKLGSVGELVYSTYLGSVGGGQGFGIASDLAGNAYVTGQLFASVTGMTSFPTTPGAYRSTNGSGFVTKLNPSGSARVYSTYLNLAARDIAVDASGRAYIAGGDDAFVMV